MIFRKNAQHGGTIFMVLIIAGVIALTLAAYMSWTKSQNVLSKRSQYWNNSLSVAEAGAEEAMAHLNATPNNRAADGWPLVSGAHQKERTLPDGSKYLVRISTDPNPVITSRAFVRAPLRVTNYLARAIQVECRRNGAPGGLSSPGPITFSGGSRVDSFNSSDPSASTGGAYDPAKATDHAKVSSNSSAAPAIKVGTAHVYGTVATGPGGTVSFGGGAVGSTSFIDGGGVGPQAGSVANDASMSFPNVSPPPTGGAFTTLPPGGTVGGNAYTTVFTSGTYDLSLLKIQSSPGAAITGDVTIYTHGEFTISGSGLLRIAPGAHLTMYVGGKMTVSGGGVLNDTQLAQNCEVYGLPTCTTATISGSGAFIGQIYAPQASLTISGSGGLAGSAVAGDVTLSGGAGFHYDEALSSVKQPYVAFSWNEI